MGGKATLKDVEGGKMVDTPVLDNMVNDTNFRKMYNSVYWNRNSVFCNSTDTGDQITSLCSY